ncbi:hypothetical protein [Clostridium beijerinckii]|uniref:hypothetical protein n=1 Tax=Clostridium beijerinckii TaxID=1520 RepID=UPI00136122DC|nr:hypothetical protein [Clostridium beijerinckii]MZK53425.1 hypothetical protein [Clostridium beijerinckii]MZK61530.1 hypothetical protein [Clostridium beijerinckii]MZK71772.1 hypothetical protein [Clostridium beijerinckii]MZK77167.1 hypothetical protein [Clostridium beijerinckii]MZK86820.1 hypothetical protein [Clostridium beijerinckii]
MKTLVIYDNSGYIYIQMSGAYRKPQDGINYLEVEIPEGKILKAIDTTTTPHTPIFEDIPKSEIDILKEKQELMQKALDDLLLSGGTL